MGVSRSILTILVWAACSQVAFGAASSATPEPSEAQPEPSETPLSEPENMPSRDDFYRRLYARSAVVGNYLYIDGEEVARRNTFRIQDPVNATLSIDLTKSWTDADVEIIQTEYGPDHKQVLLQQAIFVDESTESFYAWGGRTSHGEEIRDPSELWQFKPDGSGRGEWENATPEDQNNAFFSIKRTRNNAFVSTPGQGFVFGGITESASTREPIGTYSGYASFNFTSKEWKEHEQGPYSESKTIFGGGAVFVPNMGPNGLIFMLGGIGNREANGDNSQDDWITFSTMHFMDPVTKKWYSQETTGSDPVGRYNFCFGGVVAEGGRFDIFIYGGSNNFVRADYSDVHVLSLPGFHWTSVTNQSNRDRQRREHTCAVAGKRHLISWGGLRGDNDVDPWQIPDPSPNGIMIFDMSALQWTSEYRADAEAYEQHERITSWYNDGGLENVDWADGVKALFTESDGGDGGTPTPSPSNAPGDKEDSGSVPVGAIAGGVIGGVAVIAIVGGVFWFLRRKKRRQALEDSQPPPSHPEMDNTESKHAGTPVYYPQGYQAAPGSPPASELHSGYMPSEVATNERYEMDGSGWGTQNTAANR